MCLPPKSRKLLFWAWGVMSNSLNTLNPDLFSYAYVFSEQSKWATAPPLPAKSFIYGRSSWKPVSGAVALVTTKWSVVQWSSGHHYGQRHLARLAASLTVTGTPCATYRFSFTYLVIQSRSLSRSPGRQQKNPIACRVLCSARFSV